MSSLTNIFRHMGQNLANEGARHESLRRPHPKLIDGLPQVVFQMNRGGHWVYLNAAWTELTQYPVQECIGDSYRRFFHPSDRDLIEEHLSRTVRQTGDAAPVTARLVRKDGKSRWIELISRPLASGSSAGAVGTLTDVTERIHAEERRQAKQRSLENLTANLPGMLYRCRNDKDWTMDYVSEGCLALCGYRPDELIKNRTISWAEVIHSDDRERVWDEVQYSLDRKEPFELLYRIVVARSDVKWVLEGGRGNFASSGQLMGVEGFMADITQKKITEDRLRQAALYDPETFLPSSSLFIDRLQRAIDRRQAEESYYSALFLIRLDQYKDIVISHGAAVADDLMTKTSERLQEALEPYHSVAMLRNDRLAVLLEGVGNIMRVTTALRRLQQQIQAPVDVGDADFYTTASVGVALSDRGYKHSDDMLADANTALSRARALGGARYEILDLHSHAKAASQSQMAAELREALEKGEFRVFWQPVVALRSGRLAGLEAKMAWLHPRRGVLFTEAFVSHAEDAQLITPLWEWMLAEARRQMDAWERHEHAGDGALTVQITSNTLLDAESILRLGKQLLAAELPPFLLAVGVPSHVLTQRPRTVQRMLRRITSRNIQLILETAGTNDVSLATVRDMPIDAIRIGREIVAQCPSDNGRYIAALLAFSRSLGVTIIADGVETEHELAILRETDVDYVQGSHISLPLDAATASEMLCTADREWIFGATS